MDALLNSALSRMSYASLKLDRIENFEPARAIHSILCMLTSHTTYIHTKTKLSIMKNSEKKPIPVFIIKIAIYNPNNGVEVHLYGA